MREEFYEQYWELFHTYNGIARPRSGRASDRTVRVNVVRTAIERGFARTEFRGEVRPDARYFLLLNFDAMVAEPLARVGDVGYWDRLGPNSTTAWEPLSMSIESDVQLIVNRAAALDGGTASGDESAIDERPDVLTGGRVLRALSQVYGQLQTMQFDVWG